LGDFVRRKPDPSRGGILSHRRHGSGFLGWSTGQGCGFRPHPSSIRQTSSWMSLPTRLRPPVSLA